MPEPLGATPPDIVPLSSYTSPSSVTLHTQTSRVNVTACADAASSQISVPLKTNADCLGHFVWIADKRERGVYLGRREMVRVLLLLWGESFLRRVSRRRT
jgi:hypothetical protein